MIGLRRVQFRNILAFNSTVIEKVWDLTWSALERYGFQSQFGIRKSLGIEKYGY